MSHIPRDYHCVCEAEESSASGMLAGMLVGAALGAGLALLFAPKSGQATREELAQRLDQVKSQMEDTTRQVSDVTRIRMAEVKTDLTNAVEAGRAAAENCACELRKKSGLG